MTTLTTSLRTPGLSLTSPLGQRDVLAVCRRLFYAWLALRTAAWTLVTLAQPNPPLDVVEWLAWGREWQLGYHKHPPLAAWVAEIAYRLTPGSFLGIHLAGYLAVAAALWAVWNFASRLVPPRAALAATVCLDGLGFLGGTAAEFNNQVLLIAFWALAIERFDAAASGDRTRDWVLTGLALGLAMLCKYSTAFLILPLLAWWFWREGPRRWTRPLLVAAAAAAVFLPHFVWLVRHDFPTLRYAAQRAGGDADAPPAWLDGVYFACMQAARLLPVALILLPVLRPRRRALDAGRAASRSLLLAAVAGPFALHLLAAAAGVHMAEIWGAPLWTFAGLLAVASLKTDDSGRSWGRLRLAWAVIFGGSLLLALAGNLYGSAALSRPLRVHCPGGRLADEVTSRYRQRHGADPAVVAGDWWLAGNIACHAPHRPALYASREPSHVGLDLRREPGDPRRFLSPDPGTSPWTGDEDFRARGGVLVWDAAAYGDDLPPWLAGRFPEAEGQRALAPRCLGGSAANLRVGWAMLPPRR
jgi:hypothetical protein